MLEVPIEIVEQPCKLLWEQSDLQPKVKLYGDFLKSRGVDFSSLAPDLQRKVSGKIVTGCRACAAYTECRRPIPPSGPLAPRAVVVARSPGKEDDIHGTLFYPQSSLGVLFSRYLATAGLVRQECYLTSALHCHTARDREPLREEIQRCSVHKWHEFRALKIPKLFLLLGYDAHQMFFNYSEPSVLSVHGRIYYTEIMGQKCFVVPTLHPGQVLHDPGLLKDVARVLFFVRNNLVRKA